MTKEASSGTGVCPTCGIPLDVPPKKYMDISIGEKQVSDHCFFFGGGAFFRQTHGQTPCCKLHMAAPVINPKQK